MPRSVAMTSRYSLAMSKTIALCLALVAALVAHAALAQDVEFGPLKILHPWARATVTPTGGAYLTIDNTGAADTLLRVETAIARAELHNHVMQGNVMMMRAVDAIAVPPGRTTLGPGGYHIMLIGLKAPLKEGAQFPLKPVFEKAGAVDVTVTVDKPGAMGPGAAMPMGTMPDGMHKH
jgi:copper(I)-binding protein